MRKYNPYKNIFYYYRGPSQNKSKALGDKQIEDNTTKALINTLEYSDVKLLKSFLGYINLKSKSFETVRYELQIVEEYSRPDALIDLGSTKIYIESKVDCSLDRKQISSHLKVIDDGYLLCITPRKNDGDIVGEFNDKRLRFITWQEIYTCFQRYLARSNYLENEFLVIQFLDYLEAINMADFYGWKKSHFEAFLNIEDDPKRELRLHTKCNMAKYLNELKELLNLKGLFKDLEIDVGNIKKNSSSCWGVLCMPPISNKVHMPHFGFGINASELYVRVIVEGQKPTNNLRNHSKGNSEDLLNIMSELVSYELIFRKRVNPNNLPRGYYGVELGHLKLGEHCSKSDVDWLLDKMQNHRLFEIECRKVFSRDDDEIKDKAFLTRSVEILEKLEPFYEFCLSSSNKS